MIGVVAVVDGDGVLRREALCVLRCVLDLLRFGGVALMRLLLRWWMRMRIRDAVVVADAYANVVAAVDAFVVAGSCVAAGVVFARADEVLVVYNIGIEAAFVVVPRRWLSISLRLMLRLRLRLMLLPPPLLVTM